MGRRHQLFVIAKIGPRYRVLAAIHHQILYGEHAVAACLRTLRILRSNASMLRQELQDARQFDWEANSMIFGSPLVSRQGRMHLKEREEALRFPIITTSLMAGASKSEGALRRVHTLPITIEVLKCDNNDGFTVFDITYPENPRYCFISSDMSLTDAPGYLSGYQGGEDASEDERETAVFDPARFSSGTISQIQELALFEMIQADALSSAWPQLKIVDQITGLSTAPDPADSDQQGQSSLRTMAMRDVISQAACNGTVDPSWFLMLPDAAGKAFEHLVASPSLATTTPGLDLLCRILKGRRVIDLSYFTELTTTHVLHIVCELRKSACRISLILPRLDDLTIADVRLLALSAHVDELHLGTTTGLDVEAIMKAMSGVRLKEFSHPELYRSALTACDRMKQETFRLTDPPISKLLNEQPLSQAIYLGVLQWPDEPAPLSSPSGAPAWSQHLAARYPFEGDGRLSYDHYSGIGNLLIPSSTHILPIPLLDVALPTERLIPRLYEAVLSQISSDSSSGFYADLGFGLAISLAMDEHGKIAPLPAELLGSYEAKGSTSIEPPPKAKNIVHGEWTLLICNQAKKDEYSVTRHCLVTRSLEGQLVCRTLEDFLKTELSSDAAALCSDELKARQSKPESKFEMPVGSCDLVEAEEAIKATETYNDAISTYYSGHFGEMLQAFRQRGR